MHVCQWLNIVRCSKRGLTSGFPWQPQSKLFSINMAQWLRFKGKQGCLFFPFCFFLLLCPCEAKPVTCADLWIQTQGILNSMTFNSLKHLLLNARCRKSFKNVWDSLKKEVKDYWVRYYTLRQCVNWVMFNAVFKAGRYAYALVG